MRIITSFILFTFLSATCVAQVPSPLPSPSASPTTTTDVLVPGGTTVVMGLSEPLSSSSAKVDDQLAMVVKKEVVINGNVVIAKGANGHATVINSEAAATNGSGGKLSLSVDWVYCVDGGKIKLSSTSHASEDNDSKGTASTATLLSWAFLGPLGFFAHNFVRGKQAVIGTDKSFTVFIDKDVNVNVTPNKNDEGFK